MYNSAAIDPATGSWVTLTFDSERFDTDTMHEGVTNPSRLTVPTNGGGIYSIGACVSFDTGDSANADNLLGVRVLLNGTAAIVQDLRNEYRAEANDLCISVSTLFQAVATNYLEVQVYIDRDINVLASLNYSPEFWAIWQRRA